MSDIANRNSFLFHEAEGYESGLIGIHKPLSRAIFANYPMVETIGTLLDPNVSEIWKWDAVQWEAYSHVVLMTFRDYVDKAFWNHSFVLYRATHNLELAVIDLYKINGKVNSSWDNNERAKLRVIVQFIKKAIEILDKNGVPVRLPRRIENNKIITSYDIIASMIFKVITSASDVQSPRDLCWSIQHNSIWMELFNFHWLDNAAGCIVKYKVRRLIYNEIAGMKPYPNFMGAKILGFCLNVLGLRMPNVKDNYHNMVLQKAILSWTKKNFSWLHSYNPRVAAACLVDGITYEPEHHRLVKTWPIEGLRREPLCVYFNVDPPPPEI